MNRLLICLVVLSLTFAASSARITLHSVKAAPRGLPLDVIHFIEGFALAVDAKVGNITQCTANATITLDAFNVAVAKMKQAFIDLSVSELLDSFSYFGIGINDVSLVLEACGETRLVDDIKKLVHQLQSGPSGIITVIVKEALNILTHRGEITTDVQKFIDAWNAKQYTVAGIQAGKITVLLLEVMPN